MHFVLFGALGIVFARQNLILLMVFIEVMFLGINLTFIYGFIFFGFEAGMIYALIVLSIAAAEAAIGFGILIAAFRASSTIEFKHFNKLKG